MISGIVSWGKVACERVDYVDRSEGQRVKSQAGMICKYPALTFSEKYDAHNFLRSNSKIKAFI